MTTLAVAARLLTHAAPTVAAVPAAPAAPTIRDRNPVVPNVRFALFCPLSDDRLSLATTPNPLGEGVLLLGFDCRRCGARWDMRGEHGRWLCVD